MSVRTVVRSTLAPSLLFIAGCSDVIGPVQDKIAAVSAKVANFVTCTNTWKDPVSGNWTDATKWSAGFVPTSGQTACITVDGEYTVTLQGIRSVGGLAVGSPGQTGRPTLVLEGFQTPTGQRTSAHLSSFGDIENYGTIRLTSAGGIGASSALRVQPGALRNQATGIIETLPGAGDARNIEADVVNDGLLDFQMNTEFNKSFAQHTNNGTFRVAANQIVQVPFNATFRQNGGALELHGRFFQNTGTFHLAGGTLSGAPELMHAFLIIPTGSTAAGTVRVFGQSSLSGNVTAAQTLVIEGWRVTSGTAIAAHLTSATGFENAGTIQLTATGFAGGASAQLTTLSNATVHNTGRIEVLPAQGGLRMIQATILNDGVVDVQATASMTQVGNSVINNGSFNIASGQSFSLSFGTTTPNSEYRQMSGLTTVDGRLLMNGGRFVFGGGTITGVPELTATEVVGGAASGTVRLFSASKLTGDVGPTQVLIIEGVRTGSTGAQSTGIMIPNGPSTNNGVIRLTSSGFAGGASAQLDIRNGLFTNGTGGRIESVEGLGGPRQLFGDITNLGTISIGTAELSHDRGTLRNVATGAIVSDPQLRLLRLLGGSTVFGSGSVGASVVNSGRLHIGQSPGQLDVAGDYTQTGSGFLNIELGGQPSAPGTDFDRLAIAGAATLAGTLNVSTVSGACANGGSSYGVMTFASRSSDFATKNGLNLGDGRTVTTVPGATNYQLNVSGPTCPGFDTTPPAIVPTVSGTLGNDGWYVSDVSVTWSATDAESAVSSQTGCGATSLTSDNAGITFTCSATSAGGTASQSVTVKRDATAPTASVSRAPAANANGWNNTNVTATYAATDGMSGIAGAATATELFEAEGENQGGSHEFTDLAGNTASASVTGISIDKTAPVVTATRAPAANANGWNNTDVTASWTATDALSGLNGAASASQLFSDECEDAGATRTFTDLAGNSSSASVGGINIDKAAPTVTVTRSPLAGPDGWNETDVTVTWSATDGLSGISGPATATQVFSIGENQGDSRTFTDLAGNSATGSISGINIRAPAPPPPPPSVSCSATPNVIWPANNKMIAIQVTVTGGSAVLRSVTNNETGSADAEGWTLGTADFAGSVRATRLGGGSGRTYTLNYDVTNAGGTTQCSVTISVPHDQGKK